MGSMHGLSFKEELGNRAGLEMHLKTQFFPPHPQYVIEETLEAFEQYWKGEIDEVELADKCYLRSVDGLYRYYWMFLDDEEPCEAEFDEVYEEAE
ncbi:MAG: hypothetical protein H8D94_01840 [Candidatus Pelagibacter sp.]|nr:hypothetical protein [Candidatus Pelagibacter sp.]